MAENLSQEKKMPPSPAPNTIPNYSSILKNCNPDLLYHYLDKYIYVWLRTNSAFWFYPTVIYENTISGYAWDIFGWHEIKFSLDNLDSFY
ncbi:MAG: hypothetical protein A2Y17_08380 [Clostridiales bacterium GWF2_38_85]|nr:MAG: hypothetical protein A2Y17_08380 [Clostridiales bacterium GWF2_38_85]HBL83791.1 hypothetical protein [Clostridiales bacterium]